MSNVYFVVKASDVTVTATRMWKGAILINVKATKGVYSNSFYKYDEAAVWQLNHWGFTPEQIESLMA